MTLPQPVRLYDQRRAPNPRRVNIFLAEKGIEIERVDVNLMAGEHKQPDYVARIGVAQVPALELDDGTIVTESVAICRYSCRSLLPRLPIAVAQSGPQGRAAAMGRRGSSEWHEPLVTASAPGAGLRSAPIRSDQGGVLHGSSV